MNDVEAHRDNPDTGMISFFSRQVLSFARLLPAYDFETTLTEAIATLPREFYAELQAGNKEDYKRAEKWIPAFKNNYHKQVAGKLIQKETGATIESSLPDLDDTCEDYISWYYKDQFSIDQISAITGQSHQAVVKQLQACRIQWHEAFLSKSVVFPIAVPDEERLRRLADYFDNKLNHLQAAENVQILNNTDADLQRSDALELWLRLPENELKKKHNTEDRNAYLSAEEFLRLAKENIQQRNRSTP